MSIQYLTTHSHNYASGYEQRRLSVILDISGITLSTLISTSVTSIKAAWYPKRSSIVSTSCPLKHQVSQTCCRMMTIKVGCRMEIEATPRSGRSCKTKLFIALEKNFKAVASCDSGPALCRIGPFGKS